MFDSRLDYPNEFPVELVAPDISCYKNGNTGVDYVHTFDSGTAGPHVLITAVVHGNELCGALALDYLFNKTPQPRRGRLTLAFMNVDAYLNFNPQKANLTRWLEEDFNRLWSEDVLDNRQRKKTVELNRARAVRRFVADADLLLDIHSMQTPCPPMFLTGNHAKGQRLAQMTGMGIAALADGGHAEGTRMRDYGGFGDVASDKTALLIECGQNWEKRAEQVAIESMLRFIRHAGIMGDAFGDDFLQECTKNDAKNDEKMNCYRVGQIVTVESENFHFAKHWLGFEHLAQGTLIGHDGDTAIIAPYQPTVLIMPSRQLFVGKTAVRLAFPETLSDESN